MPWVRKDDQMPIHRKVAPLSDAAYRLHDEAICWASRNLTDGAIGKAELGDISKRGKPKVVAELVARRLWHEAGYECPSENCPPAGPNGWVIHDYWEYQPSRDQVLKEREAKAERQRRWRERQRGRNGSGDTSTTDRRDAHVDASRNGSGDTSTDARRKRSNSDTDANRRQVSDSSLPKSDQNWRASKTDTDAHHTTSGDRVDALQDALVTPAPSPPRPAPKEGGGGAPAVTAARRAAAGAGGGGQEDQNPPVTRPPSMVAAAQPPGDLLEQTRAQLRAASTRRRLAGGHRERRGLDELRAATPTVPPAIEPAPSTPDPQEETRA